MSARIVSFVAGSVFTAAVALVGIGVSHAASPAAVAVASPVGASPGVASPASPGVASPVLAAPASSGHAAPVPAAVAAARPAAQPMFQGEQALDTSGGPVLVAALPRPAARRSVRTPSDESLPKYIPVRGRLTVVESSDLAENLGLVPRGATKRSAELISAQDKLEEEARGRAASAAATPSGGYGFAVKSHLRGRR